MNNKKDGGPDFRSSLGDGEQKEPLWATIGWIAIPVLLMLGCLVAIS